MQLKTNPEQESLLDQSPQRYGSFGNEIVSGNNSQDDISTHETRTGTRDIDDGIHGNEAASIAQSSSGKNRANSARQKAKSSFYFKLAAITSLCLLVIISMLRLPFKSRFSFEARLPNIVDPLKVRIYTNNIRFDNNRVDPHERKWFYRKRLITSSIAFHTDSGNANIVCLQEVLHNQLEDIVDNLNNAGRTSEWDYYGVGRSDGDKRGEFAPILFKNSEWSVIENRTFWLSETPDWPSRGWDAALERIVTMITVQSKVNPLIKLNFFNTHFDHRGVEARRQSSLLIINRMENYNEYPSFLCGDFNTQPIDEPYQILKSHGFKDSRTLIDKLNSYGHFGTFTGFDRHNEANTIIDYIWAPYFAKNGNGGFKNDEVSTRDENHEVSTTNERSKNDEISTRSEEAEGALSAGIDEGLAVRPSSLSAGSGNKELEVIRSVEKRQTDLESVDEHDVDDYNYFGVNLHQQYKIAIKSFAILHSYFEFYMSDHRPVVADYVVERTLW